jgi:hypothetical protein
MFGLDSAHAGNLELNNSTDEFVTFRVVKFSLHIC